ncbi:predicted DNA-binding transcriptional regulator [Aliivibrio fischeri ES114]|uniref:DNA-binding transcriptional activator DecR n=1 Tax=Aliivibrio fischeri (strain ATCC 700601 / ES114) TaxID=312309 RepID=Q5E4H3_ALIF1|nr:Lrp/AsnC family transcriptional regulator [Aliivibrio fischeri]AAW86073.1 predicted DNA-binding transcriptional regulator [Aliivibrio fischeri ES114]KLU79637.1 transcriptional regulator [Aliivibrio fischeri]MCE7579477.1 Lrp/AsnC family transcriptional regulator [Aliivibrio fischeri]MCE7591764.1 Lrp/AsnC family transcriptional regulator [Aliivibrio fischeri]TGA72560.1 Lrp/AsnC family transcriptional regulator [Aliivibrio fischeri]
MGKHELDKVDTTLLSLLQKDCTVSLQELADAVNLTTTPCWKRLKRLEEEGILEKKVALLNPEKLGLSFNAFVLIKTSNHSQEWYNRFVDTVSDFPEVMEFYRMAGEYDYMMKVLAEDMKAFDGFYKKLVNSIDGISNVTSTFAMEPLKYTTELPL